MRTAWLSLLLATAVSAQETVPTVPVSEEAEAAPAAGKGAQLETLVVTARKREEPLQQVPVSISAFTGKQLDDRGIQNLRDLGAYVPGLQFTDLAGYNLVYLRGVGTDAFIPAADPSIATYLDGIYFPSAHSLAQAFGSLDRIEVLKGPQGTLFGRNSTGGALMLWSEVPGPASVTEIQAARGAFDRLEFRGHSNIALGQHAAISVSGFQHEADNYYRLLNPANDVLPTELSRGGRVRVALRPTGQLELVLTGLRARQSGTSTTTSANTHPSQIFGGSIQPETREYVVTADTPPSLITDTQSAYGQLGWHPGGIDVKLLGSTYSVNAHDYVYDFDASDQPMAVYGAISDFQRIATGELQLTSNENTWGASWFKWVAGGYYLRSRGGYNPGYLQLFDSTTFVFTGLIGAESASGYAQGTATLTDWLDVTLGGRYQRETRNLIKSEVASGDPGGETTPVNTYPARESTVNNFSPRGSIDLRPTADLLLYVSYQRGFKSATYNIINIYQDPDYVKPEEVGAWEVGAKSEWLGNTLRLNVAAFRTDIDELQTGFVSFTSGGAINFENAGRARIRGVEAETVWAPLPVLNPGLELRAAGSWLDAHYVEYLEGSGYDEDTGLAFGRDNGSGRDFSGNRIVRTPRFTGSATLFQRIHFGRGTVEVAGDYAYNSGYYYLAQNSPNSLEPSYTVICARVGYTWEPWDLSVLLFGQNLTEERYNLAQFHTDFGREDTLAPPRTFGARLEWVF